MLPQPSGMVVGSSSRKICNHRRLVSDPVTSADICLSSAGIAATWGCLPFNKAAEAKSPSMGSNKAGAMGAALMNLTTATRSC